MTDRRPGPDQLAPPRLASHRSAPRTAAGALGVAAAVQAALQLAPVVIQALGGRGLPAPDTFNDPAHALAVLRTAPDVPIVAGLICATGLTQVLVVTGLAERIGQREPRLARLSVIFGVIAASFLLIDGALGMTALPQLAHLTGDRDLAGGAYLAILGVRNGIDRVIPLALGAWALAAHWPAWRHRLLPRPVAVLGLLLGVVGVAGAVLPVAGLLSVVLGMLWSIVFAVAMTSGAGHARRNRASSPA
jgi:hypothetical protein